MPDSRSHAGACCRTGWFAQLLRWWQASQWYVVVAAGAVALGLGFLGHRWFFLAEGHAPSPLDILYPSLKLFVLDADVDLHPNWALEIARFLAPLTLGYAAVQAFVVVTLQRVKTAQLSLVKKHVVVCGLGRKGTQLVRDFRSQRQTVVAIDADAGNDHHRVCRELGAVVLVGDASHADLLRQARVSAARYVIAATGDDGANIEIAVHAYELFQKRSRTFSHPLQCLVHVVDATLCTVFRQASMFRSDQDLFEVKVFNTFENSARLLFEEHPLDRLHIGKASPVTVHLVVIGFGKMGQSVSVQAARIGHFANGRKMRISIIDKNADEVRGCFLALYPQFEHVCNVEFIQALAYSVQVDERLSRWAAEPDCLMTVAVCLDNDTRSLTRGLDLAEKLQSFKVAVIARMEEDVGLASLLTCEGSCHPAVCCLTVFGQINRVCALERLMSDRLDRIARRLHENYLAVARQDPNKRQDDEALREWEHLPECYKDTNRHVADHVDVKLRAVGLPDGKTLARAFTDAEMDMLSRMEHARWAADRLLAGWRLAPPPKNERLKTNPNLVPWEQLDDVNKEKARQAVRELHQWLSSSGPRPTGVS